MSAPLFPDSSSTPSQIRRYLRHVLITKHELSPEVATETTDKWQYGRGRNFLNGDAGDFSTVFGKELGYYLYQTVQEDEWHLFRHSFPGQIYHYGHYIGILILLTPIWQAQQSASVVDCLFRFFLLLLANAALHLWFSVNLPRRIEGTSAAWFFSLLVLAIFVLVVWSLAINAS